MPFLRPDADLAAGGWVTSGGSGSNLFAEVDEATASDADYVQSPINPANTDVLRFSFSDPAGAVGTINPLRYRIGKKFNNAVVVNVTIRLLEGTTEIASWTHTDISSTPTTHEQTLTAPQLAAITDPTALRLEIVPNNLWTPLSLGSKLWGWWDPNASALYQGTDTSSPVTTDGQSVRRVDDLSGNGRHMLAPDDVRRFEYNTNGLGAGSHSLIGTGNPGERRMEPTTGAVDWSGVTSFGAAAVASTSVPASVWGRIVSFRDNGGSGADYNTPTRAALHQTPSSEVMAARNSVSASASITANVRFRAIMRSDGSNLRLRVDGSEATPGSVSGAMNAAQIIRWGGGWDSGANSDHYHGDLGPLIVWTGTLSADELSSLDAWLAAWPNTPTTFSFTAGSTGIATPGGAQVHTFTAMSFPSPQAGRYAGVLIAGAINSSLTSVTIGGVAATKHVTDESNGFGVNTYIYLAPLASGATADVVVTASGTFALDQLGACSFVLNGLTSATPTGTDFEPHSFANKSVDLTVPANGIAIVGAVLNTMNANTWTNATEVLASSTFTIGGDNHKAVLATRTTAGAVTISYNNSSGGRTLAGGTWA